MAFNSLKINNKFLRDIVQHKKRIRFALGLMLWLCGIVLALRCLHCSTHQYQTIALAAANVNEKNTRILSELYEMQSQLQQLSSQSPHDVKNSLELLTNQLTDISQALSGTAKHSEIQKINDQLAIVASAVSDLENNLGDQISHKKYMNTEALPFQVTNLDLISGQAYVTVNYQNHVIPIGIGDSLATWKMIDADYGSQTAEFANKKGQYVRVAINAGAST